MASLTEYLRTGLNPDVQSDNPANTPLVSGWMFAAITLPDEVFDNASDAATTISTRVLALDISDITIATGERMGLGGLKQVVPTSIDLSHTFTIRMQEYENNGSIFKIIEWADKIRNFDTGIQTASNIKGHIDLLIATPKIDEFITIRFIGVFPTTVPLSGLQPDVTNNTLIELSVTFYFDRIKFISLADSSVLKSIVDSKKDVQNALVNVTK